MSAIRSLTDLLAGRREAESLTRREWSGVIGVARAEALLATTANRINLSACPPTVAALLTDARAAADIARTQAMWEAEMARRALEPAGVEFVLLKGSAYAAANLPCAAGRQIGDLDILVPEHELGRAENALIVAGWEWVKRDAYDDAYYREHMHELPPLIHKLRDRMIDVHHTILPRTHRVTPDAIAMIGAAQKTDAGFLILADADMVCHCTAHLIADGDLQGGLRNLWDFHRLVSDFAAANPEFWPGLAEKANQHGLLPPVQRAARLAREIYGTELPADWNGHASGDRRFIDRLYARDDWGRPTRPVLQQAFYIRSHWLRMPPLMLARHLWTKWRK